MLDIPTLLDAVLALPPSVHMPTLLASLSIGGPTSVYDNGVKRWRNFPDVIPAAPGALEKDVADYYEGLMDVVQNRLWTCMSSHNFKIQFINNLID